MGPRFFPQRFRETARSWLKSAWSTHCGTGCRGTARQGTPNSYTEPRTVQRRGRLGGSLAAATARYRVSSIRASLSRRGQSVIEDRLPGRSRTESRATIYVYNERNLGRRQEDEVEPLSTSKLRLLRIPWLYQPGPLGARSDRTSCDTDPGALTLLVDVRVQSFLLGSIGEHGVCGAAVDEGNVTEDANIDVVHG